MNTKQYSTGYKYSLIDDHCPPQALIQQCHEHAPMQNPVVPAQRRGPHAKSSLSDLSARTRSGGPGAGRGGWRRREEGISSVGRAEAQRCE